MSSLAARPASRCATRSAKPWEPVAIRRCRRRHGETSSSRRSSCAVPASTHHARCWPRCPRMSRPSWPPLTTPESSHSRPSLSLSRALAQTACQSAMLLTRCEQRTRPSRGPRTYWGWTTTRCCSKSSSMVQSTSSTPSRATVSTRWWRSGGTTSATTTAVQSSTMACGCSTWSPTRNFTSAWSSTSWLCSMPLAFAMAPCTPRSWLRRVALSLLKSTADSMAARASGCP
mmetsp:Transcript_7162/g.18649  ORF Transcript_7162/g.18649 Transcript_7162/m.18649 type:complete len:230 (-) Transcript_7162:943-1632(-)